MGRDTTGALSAAVKRVYDDGAVPAPVAHEALRCLVNVVATAVSASSHPTVQMLLDLHRPDDCAAVRVLGQQGRSTIIGAALAVGSAAHLDDFDDFHPPTRIHPGAACLGAALAMAERRHSAGSQVLLALGLGVETQLRVGLAVTPRHNAEGWDPTGTCGAVGAAVTAALLAGLDADGISRAVGIAASQTSGHQESFGTAVRPLHAGKAAANGVLSALLAEQSFSSPAAALEGRRGLVSVLSPGADPSSVLAGLTQEWVLLDNTYKAYPGDVVSHPAIDAALAIVPRLRGRTITNVEVHCNPLLAELNGNSTPADGWQAGASIAHAVAVALIDGEIGVLQFSDGRVNDSSVVALRESVTLHTDRGMRCNGALVRICFREGPSEDERVDDARGSQSRPLSDSELGEKFRALVRPSRGLALADRLLQAAWDLPSRPDLTALLEASTAR